MGSRVGGAPAPSCRRASTWSRTSRSCRRDRPPDIDLGDWEFTITNETGEQQRWDWAAFRALPSEPVTTDIHCVTHWSKLHTAWEGVSLGTLLDQVETSASFALASSYGGYTTNLPLEA